MTCFCVSWPTPSLSCLRYCILYSGVVVFCFSESGFAYTSVSVLPDLCMTVLVIAVPFCLLKSFSYDSMWVGQCVDVFSKREVTHLAPHAALQPPNVVHCCTCQRTGNLWVFSYTCHPATLSSWSSFPWACLTSFLCLHGLYTSWEG